MSSKRKKTHGNPAQKRWTNFAQVDVAPVSQDKIDWMRENYSESDYQAFLQEREDYKTGTVKMFQNSRYTVIRKELSNKIVWLSIRHNDRRAVRDWRHFQRIKNELAGPEREAIEIYPAESRLVDEANQYHLWVLPEGEAIPIGFTERHVSDSDAIQIGAAQRPFEED